MNTRQRTILGVGAWVIVIMLLFPPWQWGDLYTGWHFVGVWDSLSHRRFQAYGQQTASWTRLGLQLGAVAVAVGVLYLFVGGRGKDGAA